MSMKASIFGACPKRLLNNSQIRQLADWTTRGLDISQTGQLAE